MADTDKTKALREALREFKNNVRASRSTYREKVHDIIKKSDAKKAQAIKQSI